MPAERIARHKAVTVTYTITSPQGELLERIGVPVSYVHGGESGLLAKVEAALEGQAAGDTVTVTVGPDDAFGPHDPDLTLTDFLDNVPEEFRRIGAAVPMRNERGDTYTFFVTAIEDGRLTVDGNHPLAGRTLVFELQVTEGRTASPDEIARAHLGRDAFTNH